MSSSNTDKISLRQTYLSRRRGLTSTQCEVYNRALNEHLVNAIPWGKIKVLHAYLPIRKNNEIDTASIIDHAATNYTHVRIAVPKLIPGNNILGHFYLTGNSPMETNKWGIPEPVEGEHVPLYEIDAVLVPLLVFDILGNRVGYGKGHYDRFLASCRSDTLKIGLSYFEPVDRIEVEPTDVAMNKVVTPTKVWKF